MVQTKYSGDDCAKRDEIISAAQKIFGHYGLKKTSMMEIATDLSMSKGLLYYYFPDKEHLYKAVVEREMEIFKANVDAKIYPLDNPAKKLKEYVKLRLDYFRILLNLSRFRLEDMHGIKSVVGDTWLSVRTFEKKVIIDILETGNQQKIFHVKDPKEITELLFDLLRGIRISMIKEKQLFYLDEKDFNLLIKRSETFIDIFIQGLIHKSK